jgi:hypothetical protein
MKIIERTHDIETGEIVDIERQETAAEKNEREKREAEVAAIQAETAAKEAARQAVLEKLGLTADEAAALLG